MSEDQKKQLEQQLWNIANTLRGKMNADEFRDYILGFIFYKYLAEKMDIYANNILIVVQGNKVAPHNKSGCSLDESTLSSFSSKVFIGNKGIGRIGDKYNDNVITQGSPTVFAG
jgi:type I restriction-modification system DNA methylase subunit